MHRQGHLADSPGRHLARRQRCDELKLDLLVAVGACDRHDRPEAAAVAVAVGVRPPVVGDEDVRTRHRVGQQAVRRAVGADAEVDDPPLAVKAPAADEHRVAAAHGQRLGPRGLELREEKWIVHVPDCVHSESCPACKGGPARHSQSVSAPAKVLAARCSAGANRILPAQREIGGDSLQPLLVDYFTRDGSTLTMRLLASSPQIAVGGGYPYEQKYFAYLYRWSHLIEKTEWPRKVWNPGGLATLSQEKQMPLMGAPPWNERELLDPAVGEERFSEYAFRVVRIRGAGSCLGAALARMEMNSLYTELIPRLKSIELAGEPELAATTFVGGLKHPPIRYSLG